jgi:hypothetical protein
MLNRVKKYLSSRIKHIYAEKRKTQLPRDINFSYSQEAFLDQNELQSIIYLLLEKYDVLYHFPGYKNYTVEADCRDLSGKSLVEAHSLFTETGFNSLKVLSAIPHQEDNQYCPTGIVRVRLKCVRKYHGFSMGSYWGFEGIVLLLLIDTHNKSIYDARWTKADY